MKVSKKKLHQLDDDLCDLYVDTADPVVRQRLMRIIWDYREFGYLDDE